MPNRIAPVSRSELAEQEGIFAAYERVMGFVPTTTLTMARIPGLVEAYVATALSSAVNGLISEDLAQMVGHVASAADGCRYCQAHTIAHAEFLGVDAEKLDELWEFETSARFSEAERAALRLAFHAGQHPNGVTDTDIEDCRVHFGEDQTTAIVAVCALFGFLNRWNDTMATTLEAEPHAAATRHLSGRGWTPDKHALRVEGPR